MVVYHNWWIHRTDWQLKRFFYFTLFTVRLKNKLYVFKTKLQQNRNKTTTKQQQNQNFGQTKS